MKAILIFTILLISFEINAQSRDSLPRYLVSLDVASGKELLDQCSRSTPDKVKDFWKVQDSNLKILRNNFDKIRDQKTALGHEIIDLENYAYQVIGIAIKGKKYIYINAFRIGEEGPGLIGSQKDWKSKSIMACDGGKSYWGVLFDIDSNVFTQLEINGKG